MSALNREAEIPGFRFAGRSARGRTPLTRHAEARCQQRAIPPLVLTWLIAYGARVPAGQGAERVFFDKQGRRLLQREIGSWACGKLVSKLHAYAVVAEDGTVITTGYRIGRIPR